MSQVDNRYHFYFWRDLVPWRLEHNFRILSDALNDNGQSLTASRLLSTDANKELSSVGDLTSWVATDNSAALSVTDDGDGSLTLGLGSDLDALEALVSNGIAARTGSGTWAVRTIEGTSNQITVTNGDGVSGNPTLAAPQDIHTSASPTFQALSLSGAAPKVDFDDSDISGVHRIISSNVQLSINADPANLDAGSNIGFRVDGAEIARIDPTGLGIGATTVRSKLHIEGANGWIVQDEQDANPTTTELDANDAIAIYSKANTLVIAYNNAGAMTYLTIPLDGSTTTWTHGTAAP